MLSAETLAPSAILIVALAISAPAFADAPSVKLTAADQQRAQSALLRRADFGRDWQGGRVAASPLAAPGCPDFDPKESDLVVSGHADADFAVPRFDLSFDQDVVVLASAAAVQTDFARTIQPQLSSCLAYQLEQEPGVTGQAVVKAIPFPPTGDVCAAYRAVFTLKTPARQGAPGRMVRFVSDYIYVGAGRFEYSLNLVVPYVSGDDQLIPFEAAMAQTMVRRAAAT